MSNNKCTLAFDGRNLIQLLVFAIMISLFNACQLPSVLPDPTLEITVDSDQVVDFGVEVTLFGYADHSSGADIDLLWELVSQPSSSSLALGVANQNALTFLPDELGEYVIKFTATSSDDLSESDEVVITVIKSPVRLEGSITDDMVLENIYDDPSDPDYIVSASTLSIRADVVIQEGVHIIFEENAGVHVFSEGSLEAIGSESKPILMTGVQKVDGFWRGINFESRNPDNQLEYVTIEYGGSGGFDGVGRKANITLNDAIVRIANCTISHSEGLGLLTRNQEDELPSFNNNVITSNNIAAELNKSQFHFLDATTDYSGNEDDYIDSWGQNTLSANVTWKALNVPYRLNVFWERIESDLTIEKGAEFVARADVGIEILANGSISAIGTSNNPIIFRGENDVRGFWRGISIVSNTNKNELEYVTTKNGGSTGFPGSSVPSNIVLMNQGRLKMSNCTLEQSGDYGLVITHDEGNIGVFDNNLITNNKRPIQCKMSHFHYFDSISDLTGNDEDAIITSNTTAPTSVDATWKKATVPYKITDVDEIGSRITLEPGVEIVAANDAGIIVNTEGTLIASGTDNNRIVIRGEEDVQGYWIGIKIYSNKADNKMEYVNIANGGGGNGWNSNIDLATGNAMLNLTNCHITDSQGYGVYVRLDAILNESLNTFDNNKEGNIFYQ